MAKISRRAAILGGVGVVGLGAVGTVFGMRNGRFGAAMKAYMFGYPLVTMEMTRKLMTNVAAPGRKNAPMGQFIKGRQFPDATFRDVVAPNADTLYATAWVDLASEPWVLSIPDMGERYFMFPMLDAWTNVIQIPGTRTTGTGPQRYAVTGPGWIGTLPPGVVEVRSPTDMVWIHGRIYSSGTAEDYAQVHALQDALRLCPLSAYGTDYMPPAGRVDPNFDMKTGLRKQVNDLDMTTFFTMLSDLMVRNPPTAADAPMLETLAEIGVVPGKPIDHDRFDFAFRDLVPKATFAEIMAHMKFSGGDMIEKDGWAWTLRAGRYGTNYIFRALITVIGLGANIPADSVYGISWADADGGDYDGKHTYQIRFAPGQEPPARGFWSLTLYDKDFYFTANPANRYAISPRDHFEREPDGSIILHIQKDRPATAVANWLPAPDGPFQLMWRMYWPTGGRPSILNGTWTIPGAKRVDA